MEQIWLPELTLDYHFRQVARSDRCTTCHQGIEKPSALPQPFAPHPRLDLYLGAASPHPLRRVRLHRLPRRPGEPTDFHWASHTPNDADSRRRWGHELGWSANPHWDAPMLARRFHQSRCLACHPTVTDLEPSRRFPDAPAAKLMAGYHACGSTAALAVTKFRPSAIRLTRLGPAYATLRANFAEYLADHIRNPSQSLPGTRMPRQYGLWEHLEGTVLADTKRSEEAEIAAIAEELQASAKNIEPLPVPSGVTEPPSAERGRRLFQTQGCLACHRHRDFPQGQATQGPDLSRVGAKYRPGTGPRWLTGWLRDPARYASQTLMPNPLLAPLPLEDGTKMTDPAADLATYLLRDEGLAARVPRLACPTVPPALLDKPAVAPNSKEMECRPSSPLPLGRRAMAKRLLRLPRHRRLREGRTDRPHPEQLGPEARIAVGVRTDQRVR